MPYKSKRQQGYMEGCKHNRSKMRGKCPSNATIDKIAGRHGKKKSRKKKR